MINENYNQVTEEQNMESSIKQTANENRMAIINEADITNVKEDIFKRLDKRKENLEQQRSAHVSERSKNAAENQAILNKVSVDTGSSPAYS